MSLRPLAKGSRIAIIRLDHLGDILLCTPLARAFAAAGHSVDFVVPENFCSILMGNPSIQEVFSIQTVAPDFPAKWWQLARWLRHRQYGAVILPYGRPTQLLLASFFSGATTRLAMWSGLAGRLTLHHCLRSGLPDHPRHFSEIMLDLAAAVGVLPAGTQPDIALSQDEKARGRHLIDKKLPDCTRIVGVHPGCAGNTCNLPPEEYARLTQRLLDLPGVGVVVTGTVSELSLLSDWPDSVLRSRRVWNSVGALSLRELAAVIASMDLYCVPSTGPLHLASALKTPTLSPFCPLPVLSDTVWGNLGASSLVCRANVAKCTRFARREGGHCSFRGDIDALELFTRAAEFLDSIDAPNFHR